MGQAAIGHGSLVYGLRTQGVADRPMWLKRGAVRVELAVTSSECQSKEFNADL